MDDQTIQIIKEYNDGVSLNQIAKKYKTYPISISRILKKNNVSLRHDNLEKGGLYVKDGEKLIEWAKAQNRLVTKSELANVLGKKRLSHSYFVKYPELGQYIAIREQSELSSYVDQLHEWLRKNNISYKPNDKKALGVNVDALLLKPYENIALQINIKPKSVSQNRYKNRMLQKLCQARKTNITLIYLNEERFKDLDGLKTILETSKEAQ